MMEARCKGAKMMTCHFKSPTKIHAEQRRENFNSDLRAGTVSETVSERSF